MPNKLSHFAFTSLMLALTAILFFFIKLSPLKDGVVYFLLMLLESLLVLEFGFKLALEYYVASSILALIILQFPFCLSYVFVVGTWPIAKFYLQLKIPHSKFFILQLALKSLLYLAYVTLLLLGLAYFNQVTLSNLVEHLKVPFMNMPLIAKLNLILILPLACLLGHVIDYVLDNCIRFYIQHWQNTLHKALKLR